MNNQIDSLHDFAYIGITYMGTSDSAQLIYMEI